MFLASAPILFVLVHAYDVSPFVQTIFSKVIK